MKGIVDLAEECCRLQLDPSLRLRMTVYFVVPLLPGFLLFRSSLCLCVLDMNVKEMVMNDTV